MRTRLSMFLSVLAIWLAHGSTVLGEDPDAQRLRDIKLKLMSADYRADLDELARGREQLTTLKAHPTLGYLACYWSGFAGIRLAINGSNRQMSSVETERNLQAALRDTEESLRLKEDFADSHVSAGQIASWMAAIVMRRDTGMQKFKERGPEALSDETRAWIDKTWKHLKRARELSPKNPREPWVEAVIWYNIPPERGGSQEKAITMYREAVALAREERVADPLWPDWGEPEALMSLAWCLLNRAPSPDPAGARDSAEAALRLRPDWFYVREVLKPQIEKALK
jgi:hypothetical protein